MFIYIDIYIEITFQAQNGGTSALGVTSANQHLENVCVPVHVPIDQKFTIFCQPFPKCQANFGLYTSLFLIHFLFFSSFLLLFLYPIKASCPLPHCAVLWILESEDCPLHEVLKSLFASPISSLIILTHIKSCFE